MNIYISRTAVLLQLALELAIENGLSLHIKENFLYSGGVTFVNGNIVTWLCHEYYIKSSNPINKLN